MAAVIPLKRPLGVKKHHAHNKSGGSTQPPIIPRDSDRFRALYRNRGAVEREFGNLKNHYALSPLCIRSLDRVRIHADLVMLARLSLALSRARAVPLAA